ncbi:MAG TPA: lipid-transfer protein [Jiangellales bacterium]|nr:lipid-transfer protein [Jiangellales bacterium]
MQAYVAGVGMTRFEKPGRRDWDYPDMAGEAVRAALADAGVTYDEVEHAVVGYVYGDSTAGQRALYPVGMTGIPVYNVNNNCSTGSTALMLAVQLVGGGLADVVLAAGFEKMLRGSLTLQWADRVSPLDRHLAVVAGMRGWDERVPMAPQVFAAAGREHAEKYGTTDEQFALVGVKNHRHSAANPYAQFRDVYTLAEVLASPLVQPPLTRLQCSPTSEGSAAAVVMSERAVRARGLGERAVRVLAQAMTTDRPDTFDSAVQLVGAGLTRSAADQVYDRAGVGPDDVDVIELHDCFSTNELITYEALGLCEPGGAGALVADGATTYGGRWVVNPSGGLISKGHPLGATGLAQCAELTWQLRGEAGERQVEGARTALQHNIGLGGAAVVTLYGAPGA